MLRDLASGEVHVLEDFTLIGRGDGATLKLVDAGISRQHATIRREERDYWVADLGSANGTFVNDAALTAARLLKHGDQVRIASSVMVFYQTNLPEAPNAIDHARTTISAAPAQIVSQPATLFVADLRGFTRIGERLSAEQLAELLREWYADCQAIMRREGATIDKFIGDSVFAYWHGREPETRLKALRAARDLRAVDANPVTPTRVLLRERHGISLDCHIGLHVGMVALGPMGKGLSTALGDAVNVTFRIETLTRAVAQPVLVSAAFAEGLGPSADFRSYGSHQVKGRAEPVEVLAPA